MSYTAEPIIITNPSEKLLEVIKAMRERKLSKLEELRNMKSEDFTRRVILAWWKRHILFFNINTPIQLDNYENGVGYSLYFHFIARDVHSDVVEMLKNDIIEVSGK